MNKRNIEIAGMLRKVAESLEKEDFIEELLEEIKSKDLLIKELLKAIVILYFNTHLLSNVPATKDDVLKFINDILSKDTPYYMQNALDEVCKSFIKEG